MVTSSNTPPPGDAHHDDGKIKPEPPTIVRNLLWLQQNGRHHKRLVLAAGAIALGGWILPKLLDTGPSDPAPNPGPSATLAPELASALAPASALASSTQSSLSLTLRLRTSKLLSPPRREQFSETSGRVALSCGERRQLDVSFDAPEYSSLGDVAYDLLKTPNVVELIAAPPVTGNNRVWVSATVGLPLTPGCRPGSAELKLSGLYEIDLADDVTVHELPAVVPYGSTQPIQLQELGIRSIDVVGVMPEAPQTQVTLFTVSRLESSGQSVNGKVSGLFHSSSRRIDITAER